jgi:hypothetical protein
MKHVLLLPLLLIWSVQAKANIFKDLDIVAIARTSTNAVETLGIPLVNIKKSDRKNPLGLFFFEKGLKGTPLVNFIGKRSKLKGIPIVNFRHALAKGTPLVNIKDFADGLIVLDRTKKKYKVKGAPIGLIRVDNKFLGTPLVNFKGKSLKGTPLVNIHADGIKIK